MVSGSWKVLIRSPFGEPREYVLPAGRSVIGRKPDNDLVIADPSASRVHAVFEYDPVDDAVILRDLQDSAMARSSNRATRDINPGESRWYVATMGLPVQEKVIGVAREEWFEAGRLPTISSVEQALVAK